MFILEQQLTNVYGKTLSNLLQTLNKEELRLGYFNVKIVSLFNFG